MKKERPVKTRMDHRGGQLNTGYRGWNLGDLMFSVLLLVMLFQDIIQVFFSPLNYLDELYAILFFVLFFLVLASRDFVYTFTKKQLLFLLIILCYWTCGWIGSFQHHYMPLSNAIKDSLVSVKFFLAVGTSYLLFSPYDVEGILKRNSLVIKMITLLLAVACLADEILHIFPGETRMGIKAVKLLFSAYTVLSAVGILLCVIWMKLYQYYGDGITLWLLMAAFIAVSSLRMKAVGAGVVLVFLYVIVCKNRRKPGMLMWMTVGSGILMMAARQFTYYFKVLSNESARALMTRTSIKIAKDYFPLGSGWATFGSAFSIQPYSVIYVRYHLNKVYGLTPKFSSYVSDVFWPILIAELGMIGTVFFVVALLMFGGDILKMARKNAYSFASALGAFCYLLIASTGESAFFHFIAVPYAFWIGLLFAEKSDETKR